MELKKINMLSNNMDNILKQHFCTDLANIIEGYADIDWVYLYKIIKTRIHYRYWRELDDDKALKKFIISKMKPRDRGRIASFKTIKFEDIEYKYLFDVVYESKEMEELFELDIWHIVSNHTEPTVLKQWVLEKIALCGWDDKKPCRRKNDKTYNLTYNLRHLEWVGCGCSECTTNYKRLMGTE